MLWSTRIGFLLDLMIIFVYLQRPDLYQVVDAMTSSFNVIVTLIGFRRSPSLPWLTIFLVFLGADIYGFSVV